MELILEEKTMRHFWDSLLAKFSTYPALGFAGERPYTYGEFGKKIQNLRKSLENLGIKKADKVIIMAPNSPSWALTFAAVTSIGAVAVLLGEDLSEGYIDRIIEAAGAKCIFLTKNRFEALNLDIPGRVKSVININDFSILDEARQNDFRHLITDLPSKIKKPFEKKSIPDSFGPSDLAVVTYWINKHGKPGKRQFTNGELIEEVFKAGGRNLKERDNVLSLVSMSNPFGLIDGFLSVIAEGCGLYFMDKKPQPKQLSQQILKLHPALVLSPTDIIERASSYSTAHLLSKFYLPGWTLRTGAGKRLVYSISGRKFRALAGGRLKMIMLEGKALSKDAEMFLRLAGISYKMPETDLV